jgi:hypothetical protein
MLFDTRCKFIRHQRTHGSERPTEGNVCENTDDVHLPAGSNELADNGETFNVGLNFSSSSNADSIRPGRRGDEPNMTAAVEPGSNAPLSKLIKLEPNIDAVVESLSNAPLSKQIKLEPNMAAAVEPGSNAPLSKLIKLEPSDDGHKKQNELKNSLVFKPPNSKTEFLRRSRGLTAKPVHVCSMCSKPFTSKSHLMAHVALLHPSSTD